jgi:hypothetical protein
VICLSFDTDHIDETRMVEFLAQVPLAGRATFFCTRFYDCLAATDHELCPHPLLDPQSDWDAEFERQRARFPEAAGWRSHSCTFSHSLALQGAAEGYRYASTVTRMGASGPTPYREAWGLWQMPIFYMDNLDFSFSRFWPGVPHEPFADDLIERALLDDGVYVWDFHPIHLLLNSTSPDAYEQRRAAFLEGVRLEELRCPGRGARDFYDALLGRMAQAGVESRGMSDALDAVAGSSA